MSGPSSVRPAIFESCRPGCSAGLGVAPGDPVRILVVGTSEGGPDSDPRDRGSVPAPSPPPRPRRSCPGASSASPTPAGWCSAESTGPFDPSVPGEVLDLATMAAHDSDGRTEINLPGIEGWHVVVAALVPLIEMPVQALAALGAMLVLLVVFTMWMARQISSAQLARGLPVAPPRAVRECPRGGPPRQPHWLGNHRAFRRPSPGWSRARGATARASRWCLMDIDEFKRINDTKGHATGDLLAEVGALIGATIRHTDTAFRIGGDEFALLLPHTDAAGAVVVARRLLARGLEDRVAGQYRWPISFSGGVTACPEFGTTRRADVPADAALYRGKRPAWTVVTVYDPDKDHGHVDEGMRAELSSAISAVIEAAKLTPVYQPVIDLNGRVIGYEGLVRLPKEATFAHTGALFDAAEVAGRVHDLIERPSTSCCATPGDERPR